MTKFVPNSNPFPVPVACPTRWRVDEKSQIQALERTQPLLPLGLGYVEGVTHKHEKVKRWIAARPRYHVHYTPTYASWLNQVEIWFGILTQKAIRRGTFKKVKDLIANIQAFTDQYNSTSRPFVWTATAESIIAKITRLFELIRGTKH